MMSKKKHVLHKENYLANLQFDLPAGLVVFLVAVPLCLGIALASRGEVEAGLNIPLFAGIIAGIIGGIVIPILSQSQLSVCGPAAGLTAVVASAITDLQSFQAFLLALVLGGALQIILGLLRVGRIAYFVPSAVIKGMLAAIGITLIIKQIPLILGHTTLKSLFETNLNGSSAFKYNSGPSLDIISNINPISLGITLVSILIIIFWNKNTFLKNIHWLPSALIVVIVGIFINQFIGAILPMWELKSHNLVELPEIKNINYLLANLTYPDWSFLFVSKTYVAAITIGLVASLETLLTIEAVDKLDPYKRKTPLNRELLAQGLGNSVSGLIGGLPITSVIVRSSASINSGGRTKSASITHGFLLLFSAIFLYNVLNMVPLAALAAILSLVGLKLAQPSTFINMYRKGIDQFIPFITTIVAILATDLLIGVSIGLVIGLIFVVKSDFHTPISHIQENKDHLIRFNKDVSFLNKAILNTILESIEENSSVIIDGKNANFIDDDIIEMMVEFQKESEIKNITVEIKNMKRIKFSNYSYDIFKEQT